MLSKADNLGDRVNSFVSESGSGIKELFRGKLDRDTGMIELVPDGKKNLYAEIQSYKDSCDINKIVERYAAGEIDILNQIQGVYGDFSAAPTDLAESYRISRDLEYQFDRLPIEIKEKFDNNFYVWLKSVGSNDWLRAMDVKSNSAKIGDGEVDHNQDDQKDVKGDLT